MKLKKFNEMVKTGIIDLDKYKIVMSMEYKWTYLYMVDIELYNEIIDKYGSLDNMYDLVGGREVDEEAKSYLERINNSETIDSDGYIVY